MAELVLVRHGETEWSRTGQHTGVTDIPLTDEGRRQSVVLGELLAPRSFGLVLASPRRRAQETADIAGLLERSTDEDLVEWDYGAYEGRTTEEISAELGISWEVFDEGTVPGDTPGETVEQVATRARAVLDRVRPVLDEGADVALIGHGHQLRILLTQWLGLEPKAGAMFRLDAGTLSTLGREHDIPAVRTWNVAVG